MADWGGDEGASYLSEVAEPHREPTTSPPEVAVQMASERIANALRIDADTQVISRHKRRFIKGMPWSMQTSYYPWDLVDRGAKLLLSSLVIAEGMVKYLADTLNIRQVGYRDWITVRTPGKDEVYFFGLPPDGRVPVYEIFRTAFDQTGMPIRLTVTVFPADRNQFIVNIGDVPDD